MKIRKKINKHILLSEEEVSKLSQVNSILLNIVNIMDIRDYDLQSLSIASNDQTILYNDLKAAQSIIQLLSQDRSLNIERRED